jgi:hypothetical protein
MAFRLARCLSIVLLTGFIGQADASPAPKAVVELFTSQGCSSCPPADEFLRELAGRPDVLALSLPVDYWDYLGWKDTLAQPAFTARQRAYAKARGDKQVYTPQAIVNGTAPCIGSDRAKLDYLIAKGARLDALAVSITVTEGATKVKIDVAAAAEGAPSGEVWILPVLKAREVAIGKGENRGRSVTYANVVRGMTRVGFWSGEAARYEVPLTIARAGDAEGYVILLQAAADESKPGPILGAAKGPGL